MPWVVMTHGIFLWIRANLCGRAVVIADMNTVVRIPSPLPHGGAAARGFGRGTRVLTPDGPVPVEEIEPGEAVLDPDGRPHFVLWQGRWEVSLSVQARVAPLRHGVVIAANAFGPGKPRRDLCLSQDHRVIVETARGAAAVAARTLVPRLARWTQSGQLTSYHAIVTRSPCVLMAENLPCQSHEPGRFGLPDQPWDMPQGVVLSHDGQAVGMPRG